jgi:ankyrin repeat protein
MLLDYHADINQKGSELQLGQTALHKAAFAGHLEIIGLLIAAKADIEARDMFGQPPLITAAGAGREAAVKALLAAGANRAAVTNDGKNARMVAQEEGHSQIVKLLSTAR